MTVNIGQHPFPESWYRVASSHEVERGGVVRIRAFGQELVVWREQDGLAHVVGAYCPHLGAHLGYGGFVEGDYLVCPFHHWRFNGAGNNVLVPYRDRPQRGARLDAMPTLERNGQVLAWYSDSGREPGWEPPSLPEADDPDWVCEDSQSWDVHTHVQEIFENVVDVAHFQYVHGVSGFGAVEVLEDGPMFRATASVTMQTPRGAVEGAVESELWGLGLDLVRQRGIGDARAIYAITPIEEGLARASYRFLLPRDHETGEPTRYGRAFTREFARQMSQDNPIWDHKIHRQRPMLTTGEGAIIDYRKWADQFYDFAPASLVS